MIDAMPSILQRRADAVYVVLGADASQSGA